ncbi:fibronectin type III domain-containing protein [Pinibacter aurantiacus]|uniref:Fibronectin type III domain-containing protein n=1 Tax=Pinibacter aurantiacus TaxID=2851599 RepID=A0A9E2W494_9BACT|nr:fibronectin type III domain-containing protein [Pinibacter aurantiacus]MBV4357198.1 fibronectin type III domain-containing protein [Pinibacter aurantiacus]
MSKKHLIRSIKNVIITLQLLVAAHFNAQAQIYPVQVMPQLIAPYTASIPEYYNGTNEKFVVLLVNTDLTKPTLQVRLKLTIQGGGIVLTSRDDVYYPALTLDAGVAQRITLNDLAPYFDANNLIFQGITRAQYQQTRRLNDGFYQFCVEAYEYNTNRLVGRSNCAMAWISLLDPPILNLPIKSESIAYRDPTNIIFQWTPRNLSSPTAAFNTEYEFTLVELWDNGIAPEAAFNTTQPLYRTTTQATTLLYGPSEPLLIPGKRYGWRIRAQASDGSQNSDAYKNNGYSEIYWFTYQRNCPEPFNVQCDVSGGRATITWSANAQQNRYTVDYREKNQSGSSWYTVNSTTNRVMLYDLKKDKQYEYRVGGFCDLATGNFPLDGAVYTNIKTFALNGSNREDNLACGILQPELKIANRTSIQSLISGEIITAGDFPVKLINVQGSNGNFTGNGYVTVPFLGKAAVKVRFSNINVNTDKQLIGGLIETTYDARETQIVAVDTLINDLNGLLSGAKNKLNDLLDLNDPTKLKKAIDSIENATLTKVENDSIRKEISKKFEEIKGIAANVPLNTPENKESVTTKLDEIQQLAGSGSQGNAVADANKPKADRKSFYSIEGNKFYNGDTIFLPKSNKLFTFKAYCDSIRLFSKNSVWNGLTARDSATATFVPSTVSTSIRGSRISTIYNDSLRHDTLICKVVVVDVKFSEDPNQLWGFDENEGSKEDMYVPAYKLSSSSLSTTFVSYNTVPAPGIPWKSVEDNGNYDKVNVQIFPPGAEKKVFFRLKDSINYNVRPQRPTTNPQTIEINNTVNTNFTELIPRIGNFENDTLQLKIKGYTKVIKKVAIITINESNDDVQLVRINDTTLFDTTAIITWGNNRFLDSKISGDDRVLYRSWANDSVIVAGPNKRCETKANNRDIITTVLPRSNFQAALNSIYKNGVVEWEVDPANYVRTINYDFNKDSMLDVSTWATQERLRIIDSCGTNDGRYNLFVVDFPSDGAQNGMMKFNQLYGFFYYRRHPSTGGSLPGNVYKTAAHECGHGGFGFWHPWNEFSVYPDRARGNWNTKDANNLMEWDGGWNRDKIRKYQWDLINRH